MNVLITGTNGFIGSHVAQYFREHGEYVIGLGRRPQAENRDLVDEYYCCDLATDSIDDLFGNIKAEKIDAVIHLAADMRHEPYNVEVVTANCGGTQRLLEFCEKNKICVFLQLSSLPVIGHPVEHPITESHPLAPYTVYHITKHTEEMLAEYAYKYRGIRTASFRISAPIGQRMNEKTIFPTFVRNALAGEPIRLTGKGTRRQNYVHVEDISQALYKAMYAEKAHGVYNLTGNLLYSNYELADKCVKLLKSKSKIEFTGTADEADSYIWDASLDRIKQDINYAPQVSIEEAIAEYANWLRKR